MPAGRRRAVIPPRLAEARVPVGFLLIGALKLALEESRTLAEAGKDASKNYHFYNNLIERR